MDAVRLVQLTDTHIIKTPGELLYGVDSAAALIDAVDAIGKLSPAPSAILLTGDIAQDGHTHSYQRVKTILQTMDLPVFALPGNHDDLQLMVAALVDDKITICSTVAFGAWRCLFLNSTVAKQDHGFVTKEAMHNLTKTLQQNNQQPTVIAMHHGPTAECSAFDCQLKNRAELLALLHDFSCVKAVVAGHVHCEADQTHQGVRLLATPSTFLHVIHHSRDANVDQSDVRLTHTIDGKRRGFRILDLYDDGRINTEVQWY